MSSLPLYRTDRLPSGYKPEYNAGLWYNKFFDKWTAGWQLQAGEKNTGKRGWVGLFDAKEVGSTALIQENVDRMSGLMGALDGEILCFATAWHFVTGLGVEHPVENGFTWHYSMGVPFIPASTVKGVIRSWALVANVEKSDVARIFGSEDGVGSIVFFDALPTRPVRLQADVMTPHYVRYYLEKDKQPCCPGDWDDPTPIPFLTVAPRQVFMFPIAPRRKERPECRADLRRVCEWLEQALEWVGMGAKTSVGYGRFDRRPAVEQGLRDVLVSQREADRLKAMGPIRQEMEGDGYSDENTAIFMAELSTKWLDRMDSPDTVAQERQEIAGFLKAWYKEHRRGQWKKPKGKNIEKVDRIKRALKP